MAILRRCDPLACPDSFGNGYAMSILSPPAMYQYYAIRFSPVPCLSFGTVVQSSPVSILPSSVLPVPDSFGAVQRCGVPDPESIPAVLSSCTVPIPCLCTLSPSLRWCPSGGVCSVPRSNERHGCRDSVPVRNQSEPLLNEFVNSINIRLRAKYSVPRVYLLYTGIYSKTLFSCVYGQNTMSFFLDHIPLIINMIYRYP